MAKVKYSFDDLDMLAAANLAKREEESRRQAAVRAVKDKESCDELVWAFNKACDQTLSKSEISMRINSRFFGEPIVCLRKAVAEKGFNGYEVGDSYSIGMSEREMETKFYRE